MTGPWKPTLAAVSALVACGIGAAPAGASPVASVPPAISGTSAYGQTLTCKNGTWSAGAGSFTYQWQLADGNVAIGSGTTLRLRARWVGLAVVCAVSAKDTTGTATAVSPPVTVEPASAKVTITKARQTISHTIEVEGRVSPMASLKGGAGSLVLYRQTTAGLQQLSFGGLQTRPAKNGAFRLVAGDQPIARSTYVVQYVPSGEGYPPQVLASRKIRVRS
jgi:hypothetical protein